MRKRITFASSNVAKESIGSLSHMALAAATIFELLHKFVSVHENLALFSQVYHTLKKCP